jgi:inorganic pyrophosphatase
MPGATRGDLDPLDICVLSERRITRGEVLIHGRVIGGLPMLDAGEADDKIVAVMRDDPMYGAVSEIDQVPGVLIDRLIHYFSTYKSGRAGKHEVSVGDPYSRTHAEQVIQAAMADYQERFAAAGP